MRARLTLFALALCAAPAFADDAPLKLEAKPQLSREQMIKRSAEASRGYYKALIDKQYEQAASFLHPGFTEGLRQRMLEEIERAPLPKQKATLNTLGVSDLTALRTLPAGRFFLLYVNSSYGVGLRALSAPELLTLRPVVETQSCAPEERACRVTVRLKGKRQDESAVSAVNDVYVVEHEGRWLVSDSPPR